MDASVFVTGVRKKTKLQQLWTIFTRFGKLKADGGVRIVKNQVCIHKPMLDFFLQLGWYADTPYSLLLGIRRIRINLHTQELFAEILHKTKLYKLKSVQAYLITKQTVHSAYVKADLYEVKWVRNG